MHCNCILICVCMCLYCIVVTLYVYMYVYTRPGKNGYFDCSEYKLQIKSNQINWVTYKNSQMLMKYSGHLSMYFNSATLIAIAHYISGCTSDTATTLSHLINGECNDTDERFILLPCIAFYCMVTWVL